MEVMVEMSELPIDVKRIDKDTLVTSDFVSK